MDEKPGYGFAVVHQRCNRGNDAQAFSFDRADQRVVVSGGFADDLRTHQEQTDGCLRVEQSILLPIPFLITVEHFEQLRRVRVIDRDGRHLLFEMFDSYEKWY